MQIVRQEEKKRLMMRTMTSEALSTGEEVNFDAAYQRQSTQLS